MKPPAVGVVYVLRDAADARFVKVGRTTKPRSRIYEQGGLFGDASLVAAFVTAWPARVEERAHHVLHARRIYDEWFFATPEMAADAIRRAMDRSSFIPHQRNRAHSRSMRAAGRRRAEGRGLEDWAKDREQGIRAAIAEVEGELNRTECTG